MQIPGSPVEEIKSTGMAHHGMELEAFFCLPVFNLSNSQINPLSVFEHTCSLCRHLCFFSPYACLSSAPSLSSFLLLDFCHEKENSGKVSVTVLCVTAHMDCTDGWHDRWIIAHSWHLLRTTDCLESNLHASFPGCFASSCKLRRSPQPECISLYFI